MLSRSRIVVCAAGGGKTTRIVNDAVADVSSRLALVTYTRANEREIERKFEELGLMIPARVDVMTWLVFLLHELARPYRNVVHDERIEGICWVEGRSVPFVKEANVRAHYFADGARIYSDKLAKFVIECNRRSGGAVMRRLAQRFDHVVIDEVQDLAGYDLDVLELMMTAGIRLSLVGDHRQAILQTNHASKNRAFAGVDIIKKLRVWAKAGLAVLTYERHTYRCRQEIADLADSFFPSEPATSSANLVATGHDGVFVVSSKDVAAYVSAYSPEVLRYSRTTDCQGLAARNFGEAKGLTFDRVLIFPHGPAKKWLRTADILHMAASLCKMYVGVTRARYSVAFVFDGKPALSAAAPYSVET